jgi:hypothetical protein
MSEDPKIPAPPGAEVMRQPPILTEKPEAEEGTRSVTKDRPLGAGAIAEPGDAAAEHKPKVMRKPIVIPPKTEA